MGVWGLGGKALGRKAESSAPVSEKPHLRPNKPLATNKHLERETQEGEKEGPMHELLIWKIKK